MSTSANTTLQVKDVNSYYDESHILHDVNLEVDNSEIVAILGRNGVGKTTLLRSIMGSVIPQSGLISHKGDDITAEPTYERSKSGISLVPQERRILPNLTVKENLKVAEMGEGKVLEIDEIYRLFPRLEERTAQYGYSLSGGEKQMLAIARALVQKTDLILLDEPYEGLAPQIIDDVHRRITEIAEKDISIIIVGQNVSKTLDVSDRAYIVNDGQIVVERDANTLLNESDVLNRWLSLG